MDTEYFNNPENEPCISRNGVMKVIQFDDYDIINELLGIFATSYPEAYEAVSKEYAGQAHYRWLMARRIIRCNFGIYDNVPDVNEDKDLVFEHVCCPLRGECRMEGVICHPKLSTELTRREFEVLKYIEQGMNDVTIGNLMFMSPQTVYTHRRNIRRKLNAHSNFELIETARKNNLI